MTPDNSTFGFVYGIVGAAASAAVAYARWKKEARNRPLYENGQREEIVKMLRKLSASVDSLENRIVDLEQSNADGERIHRRLLGRLAALEGEKE